MVFADEHERDDMISDFAAVSGIEVKLPVRQAIKASCGNHLGLLRAVISDL